MQDVTARNLQNQKFSDDDLPSAPPFCGSGEEVKLDKEKTPAAKVEYSSPLAESNIENVAPTISVQDNIAKGTCDSSIRFV